MAQLQLKAIHAAVDFSEELIHDLRVAGEAARIQPLHGTNEIVDLALGRRIIGHRPSRALQVRQTLVKILLAIRRSRAGIAGRGARAAVLVIAAVPAAVYVPTRTATGDRDAATARRAVAGVATTLARPFALPLASAWPCP